MIDVTKPLEYRERDQAAWKPAVTLANTANEVCFSDVDCKLRVRSLTDDDLRNATAPPKIVPFTIDNGVSVGKETVMAAINVYHERITLLESECARLAARVGELEASAAAMREALLHWAIEPVMDCPGDAPECVGVSCLECKQEAADSGRIKHLPSCALSSDAGATRLKERDALRAMVRDMKEYLECFPTKTKIGGTNCDSADYQIANGTIWGAATLCEKAKKLLADGGAKP